MKPLLLAAMGLCVLALARPVRGQFSSDIPGIPRAALPQQGSRQSRVEFEVAGVKRDTTFVQSRLGLGFTWRVGSIAEAGFDLSLGEGALSVLPKKESNSFNADSSRYYGRGVFGYGLRIGAKVRPIAYVSPEGYGVSAAVGAAWAPSLGPGFTVISRDSVRTAGFGGERDGKVLLGKLPEMREIGVMVSFRSRRITADAALVDVSVSSQPSPSLTAPADGVAAKAGALLRLTPGFALGASYWGDGEAPWRNRIGVDSWREKTSSYGFVFSFGSRPEAGTDWVISSPTGSFSESVRVYIRGRHTF